MIDYAEGRATRQFRGGLSPDTGFWWLAEISPRLFLVVLTNNTQASQQVRQLARQQAHMLSCLSMIYNIYNIYIISYHIVLYHIVSLYYIKA